MSGCPRRAGGASRRVEPSRARLRPLLAALAPALLCGLVSPTSAQEAEGPERIGAFVHVDQEDAQLLVTPDTASSLNEGARLFLRCRDGSREVFVAVTGEEGGLGNERDGSGGQFRIDRGPWTDIEQWGANSTGTAAFMASERVPTFVGRAANGDIADIRIVNPAGVSTKFVFRLEGMEEALGRLPCMGD